MKISSKKNIVFICSLADGILQVVKCLALPAGPAVNGAGRQTEFLGLEVKRISSDEKITEELTTAFNKLGYNGNSVILSLPRAQSTCRYLKIPSLIPEEIERIAHLQAPRYLPYQEHELITGYQHILTDKEGFSDINLVIVHRDLIERYLKILIELKPAKIMIVMSSYGICNLYNYLRPENTQVVMIVTFDALGLEMAVIENRKLVFSRSARINRADSAWENSFIMELRKTQDAYTKDVPKRPLSKIVFLFEDNSLQKPLENVRKDLDLPVEALLYGEKINLSQELLKSISQAGPSFAGLFGLGLMALPESLNLLSKEAKEKNKMFFLRRERLKAALFILGIILIAGIGMMKNLDNKAMYLEKLKAELNKISKVAKPLEEKDRRLRIIEGRQQKEADVLDIIYELHRILPGGVSLVNFTYEEGNQAGLRGYAPELNSVFQLAAGLEKSTVFKNFSVKIRYATKKKTQVGEMVDFEIACARKSFSR